MQLPVTVQNEKTTKKKGLKTYGSQNEFKDLF